MTYYALCVTICLAALILTFAPLAAVCWIAEWFIAKSSWSPETRSRAVLACRVAPLALSLGLVALVVLPSFLRWEPAATGESVGWRLLSLSAVALVSIAWLAARTWRIAASTREVTRAFAHDAAPLPEFTDVYQLADAGALVATVGIVKPRIFVSSDVVGALTAQELAAALAHERAHVHSRDNLKRAILSVLRLPFSAGDRAWTAGSEIDADLHAICSGAAAVDLASALVKVGRLKTSRRWDACAATCLIPQGEESALADRVRRLKDLVTSGSAPAPRRGFGLAVPCALAVAFVGIVLQPATLHMAHELIERLV